MLNFDIGVGCGGSSGDCAQSGCKSTPDFCIKRGDTRPLVRVSVEDCDGAVDLSDENLVVEASMWFDAKLKAGISDSATSILFADNIGFEQVSVGDVVVVARPRSPEKMLVVGVDESAKAVVVERGRDSTSPSEWPKGTPLHVFSFINQLADVEMVMDEVESVDGTSSEVLSESFVSFPWQPSHTALPGCYMVEFKMTMMEGSSVAWTKRIPLSKDGFLVRVVDSATEN